MRVWDALTRLHILISIEVQKIKALTTLRLSNKRTAAMPF